MLVALAAGEHMLLVGPPGTAKSALVRHLARLIDARYFEYLLTRFSEPSELFGPVDIKGVPRGHYVRRTEAMLPEAEIAFLDEIFKSNSAILNSLLTLLNERRFFTGSRTVKVPLSSLYGATNEIPNDDALSAVFDRFLIRARSENLDSFHFHGLIERGVRAEVAARHRRRREASARSCRSPTCAWCTAASTRSSRSPRSSWLATRASSSRSAPRASPSAIRRVVKLLKLFAASALIDGRAQVNDSDLFVLKHVWNSVDQAPLLADMVTPVPRALRARAPRGPPPARRAPRPRCRAQRARRHPLDPPRRRGALRRAALLAAAQPAGHQGGPARHRHRHRPHMVAEVDKLLEGVFESSRWNG
jgi:MoxR-like ATPase